jgi:hypothetical protein
MTGAPAEVLDSARFRVAVVGGTGSEQQLDKEAAGDRGGERKRS